MKIGNIFTKIGSAFRSALQGIATLARTVFVHLRKILAVTFTSLAVFCGVYWLLCGILAGFGISVLWIWLVAGLFFEALALWYGGRRPFRRLSQKRALRVIVSILLVLCFVFFAVIEGLVISGMNARGESDLDYIIVLGAKVNGTRPSLALRCRIDRAYEYLRDNPNTVAIVSGGRGAGEDISEAEAMRRALVERGIADERIILEDRSTSTEENLEFSYALITESDADIGLVTNNFHIWRAVRIARSSGHNAIGVSASYPNVLIIHYMVREFLSITFYALTGKI
ncbi:MAG: YdcF family protein [Clostridia bacterium]|nr:YdcF family protein [Clostridia bacterium]